MSLQDPPLCLAGGILAGVISDRLEKRASTCGLMLLLAAPTVSLPCPRCLSGNCHPLSSTPANTVQPSSALLMAPGSWIPAFNSKPSGLWSPHPWLAHMTHSGRHFLSVTLGPAGPAP